MMQGLKQRMCILLSLSCRQILCFVPTMRTQSRSRTSLSQSSASPSVEYCNTQHGVVNTTISFPVTFSELMVLSPGAFVESPLIPISFEKDDTIHNFRVKLFPRGASTSSGSGFGMSYKVLPLLGGSVPEKVGVYLQYVPNGIHDTEVAIDASFALRLVGRQASGPRFDVEWRAGMRFTIDTKLAEGRANDFGAHIMQTPLLAGFLGVDDENYFTNKERIEAQVEIQLHKPFDQQTPPKGGIFTISDIRSLPNDIDRHDIDQVRVGRVVVPVLTSLNERQEMFNNGVYPGVEYRILRVIDPETKKDIFYSKPKCEYEIKPIYPLVEQLERPWPVAVKESDIPKLLSRKQYNAISAVGSLLTAFTGLLIAFVLSQAVSLFYIPSRSMDPTLEVGDVLLVEKVSPRLLGGYHTGDVVLFSPPSRLREIVTQSGGRISDRDLFVKRIAAESGDTVAVDSSGTVKVNGLPSVGDRNMCSAEPLGLIRKFLSDTGTEETLQPGEVAVLGDCSSVSIDSRVWGALPNENIMGRPLVRLWPLAKFGSVPDLPPLITDWNE